MSQANQKQLAFQAYQLAFTKRLRAPDKYPIPDQVPADRMGVYEDLIFNNLSESVSLCFPVAKSILGEAPWQQLMRLFFEKHSANSPIFREIPKEFLDFLMQHDLSDAITLPTFLQSLCHYEWIELSLSTQKNANDPNLIKTVSEPEALLENRIAFISPMELLHYDYSVHTLSVDNQSNEKNDTHLLVYRDATHTIQFIALNAMTYELIRLLAIEAMHGQTALRNIAQALNYEDSDAMIAFGLDILLDLAQQGVITGIYPS